MLTEVDYMADDGELYHVLVYHKTLYSSPGSFSLSVTEVVSVSNDICGNAIPAILDGSTMVGFTRNATSDAIAFCG